MMQRFSRFVIAMLLALCQFQMPAFATSNLSPGYISNNSRTQGDVKSALEQMVLFAGEHLGAAAETTLTISGNAVTPPTNGGNLFSIDTSGGAGNLDNIVDTNVPDGRLLLIRCANPSGNPVTVRHNQAGSLPILLSNATNFTFGSTKEWLLLKRTGSNFEEVGRFYGDQTSAFATYLGLGTAAAANTGTSSSNVPTISQADARYASLAGSSGQVFSSATPSSGANTVNLSYLQGNYVATKRYQSGVQGFAGSSAVALTHGLGAVPTKVWFVLTCTTANETYSPGDQVILYPGATGNGGTSAIGCYVTSTQVIVTIGTSANSPLLTGKTGGAGGAGGITWADWSEVVYAEL